MPESVATTVKPEVPAEVGVPKIDPALLKDRPAGSDEPDASVQATAPVPPLDCKVAAYAVPTTPLDNDVVVIVRGAGALIAMLSC